jgi:hypothetical protein
LFHSHAAETFPICERAPRLVKLDNNALLALSDCTNKRILEYLR